MEDRDYKETMVMDNEETGLVETSNNDSDISENGNSKVGMGLALGGVALVTAIFAEAYRKHKHKKDEKPKKRKKLMWVEVDENNKPITEDDIVDAEAVEVEVTDNDGEPEEE